jgi:hypothetical protein
MSGTGARSSGRNSTWRSGGNTGRLERGLGARLGTRGRRRFTDRTCRWTRTRNIRGNSCGVRTGLARGFFRRCRGRNECGWGCRESNTSTVTGQLNGIRASTTCRQVCRTLIRDESSSAQRFIVNVDIDRRPQVVIAHSRIRHGLSNGKILLNITNWSSVDTNVLCRDPRRGRLCKLLVDSERNGLLSAGNNSNSSIRLHANLASSLTLERTSDAILTASGSGSRT